MQILELENVICEQRKKMGGVHNSTAKHIAIHKKKAVLENRLDKVDRFPQIDIKISQGTLYVNLIKTL